ncbi:HAD domain-containing protein [Plantactinospora sp. CA-290183]|uniref:HAD domain-containing protein n=1 Tax=Plantactinospora sp. CA-290183 TaxID=3240006 RepID=UPI003D9193EA
MTDDPGRSAFERRSTPPGRGRPNADSRPVVAIDVDGVLNPDRPSTARALGYLPHHYDGPSPTGAQVTGVIWLHPQHGAWLRELADQGADLVWCTSWGQLANSWLALRLGLPTDLPVIDVGEGGGVRFGRQPKLGPLYRYTGQRPVVVLDDEIGGKDPDEATRRTAAGTPTLLVPIDPGIGLQRAHIDQVATWLRSLPARAEVHHPPRRPATRTRHGGLEPRVKPAGGIHASGAHPGAPWSDRVVPAPEPEHGVDEEPTERLSVGDPVLRKSRLLSRQCDTCVFRPGNLMQLSGGRLRDLVNQTLRDESFIICHETLPYAGPANNAVKPAICRGFADRYSTQALQVIERLFGFVEVDPPTITKSPESDGTVADETRH